MELDNNFTFLDYDGPETKELNLKMFDFIYVSNDCSTYLESANYIEKHLLTKKDAENVFGQIYEIIEDTDGTDFDKFNKAFLLTRQILSNNSGKGSEIFDLVVANNSKLFEEFYDKIKEMRNEQEEFKEVINLYHELKIIFDGYKNRDISGLINKPRISQQFRKSLKITEDNVNIFANPYDVLIKQSLSRKISQLDSNQKIVLLEKFKEEIEKEETESDDGQEGVELSDKVVGNDHEFIERVDSKDFDKNNIKNLSENNLQSIDNCSNNLQISNDTISHNRESSNSIAVGNALNILVNIPNNFSKIRGKRPSLDLMNKLGVTQKKLIEEVIYVSEAEMEDVNFYFNKNDKTKNEISFISIHLLLKYLIHEVEFYYVDNKLIKAFVLQKSGIINSENLANLLFSYIEKSHINQQGEKSLNGLGLILINWVYYRFEDEIYNNNKLQEDITKLLRIILTKQPYITFEDKILNIENLISLIQFTPLNFDNNKDPKFISSHRHTSVQKIKKYLDLEQNSYIETFINSQYCNSDRILPNSSQDHFDIRDWSELEIARQITSITHFIFCKIKPNELINSQWTKYNKTTESPHVVKMIDRFNKISFWVCEEILAYDKAKFRAETIEKCILVAYELTNLNNFNDAFAFIIALNSYQIKSLQKSWNRISLERIVIYKDLEELFSYSKNFALLREKIEKVQNEPCIPYLGYFLKELAFLDEGPKYVKDINLINVEKIRKIQKVFDKILKYQSLEYRFKPVYKLSFLADPCPLNEDQLTEISGSLEPIFLLSDKKSGSKRLTKTDLADGPVNLIFKDYINFFNRSNENYSIREKIKNLSEWDQ